MKNKTEFEAGMIVKVRGPYIGKNPLTGKDSFGYDEITGWTYIIGEVLVRHNQTPEYRLDNLSDSEPVSWTVGSRLTRVPNPLI